ncbi:hypothetical protein Maes01_02525 [Microbulbifer aestuariivivens]|uniref:Lipoprotein n=1 Tax=Microbulbifer aestuariivivens TaxID=1908308 RepID=A0ABP9WRX7_9GAMM
MRNFIILCISLAISACAYIETYTLSTDEIKTSEKLKIIDYRTEKQKNRNLGLFDNSTIYQFRDNGFRPSIGEYLSLKLPELDGGFVDKEIRITEFKVIQDHTRREAKFRGSALAGISLPAAILINNSAEIPEGSDSISTFLGLVIDGEEYYSIYSYPMGVYQLSSTKINGKSILMHSVEGAVTSLMDEFKANERLKSAAKARVK